MIRRVRGALAPAALAGLVLAFYGPALGRYFTSEDFLLIRFLGEHPPWQDLRSLWTGPWLGIAVVKFYRPVSTLLYGLEIAAFGGRPFGYNLVHILVHVGNAVLAFKIAQRLGRRLAAPPELWTPFAAAALFALYPLHPNAVVFGASFATLFGASFLLAAFLAYQRFRGGEGGLWWGGALALFLLALGSYEAAAVFPALLAAHDHLLGRPRAGEPARRPWALLPGYLPFFGVLGLYFLLRRSVFGVVVGGYEEYSARLLAPQWVRGLQDVAVSIEKLYVPVFEGWPSLGEAAAFCGLVLFLPLTFFWLARRRLDPLHLRLWLFAWAWTLISQAPFAFRPSVPGNGRYWYLAAAGIAMSTGFLARAAASVLPDRWRLLPSAAVAVFGIFWAVLLGGYVGIYRDAGRTARAIQAELVRVGSAPGAPRRLFVARYPYFLADAAQVFHYGLRDSVRPPFVDSAVSVYPLPPLPDAGLLPVARAEPDGVYAWDEASATLRKVAARGADPGRGLGTVEIVKPREGEILSPAQGLEVQFLPRPGERFRLVLVAGGNATLVDLQPVPGPGGAVRAPLPADFLLSMSRLYGGAFFAWIEARDAAGTLSRVSRLRSFRLGRLSPSFSVVYWSCIDRKPPAGAKIARTEYSYSFRGFKSTYSGKVGTMPRFAFNTEFLQSVNRVPVTKEEMLAIAMARGDEDVDHSLESALYDVHEQHPGNQEKVQAIMFRMEALGRIVDERGLPGWASPPRSDGMVTLQEPVLAAAATVPLVLEGKELAFDYDRLLGKILDLAELDVQG